MSRIYMTCSSICITVLFFTLSACSEFFEEDISDKNVILKTPVQDYKSVASTINFSWTPVEGAVDYHLQVVSPSFKLTQILVLDTFINYNYFSYNFVPGKYEWAVTAYNYSSYTSDFIGRFSIDTSSILTGVEVKLKAPGDNTYFKVYIEPFKWELLPTAKKYSFTIYKDSQDGDVIFEKTLTKDTISYKLNEGVYYWSVQAINDISASMVRYRKITIDKTAPDAPILDEPGPGDTLYTSDKNIFTWYRTGTSLAPIKDSIIISTDTLFRKKPVEYAFSDSTSYQMKTKIPGKYFWKVRSRDMAGNLSDFSIRKFILIDK